MKYYSLSYSTDEKEVGKVWPQCKAIPEGYDHKWLDLPNSMTKLTNDDFPNEDPNLVFELDKKSKLTDVISPSNIYAVGLLVNNKVKSILEIFNLITHKFYLATVKQNHIEHNYYWLHLVKPDLLGVNFEKSKFEITNLVNKPLANIKINSWEDYIERNSNLVFKHIRAKHLVLEPEAQKDLIYFPYIYSFMFVSEELSIELASQRITGLEISEQHILI